MHPCQRQTNFTRRICCQLVLLLNDTATVPLCDVGLFTESDNSSNLITPSVILDEPSDAYENHVTFLLGVSVLMLVSMVCICTWNRLVKPRSTQINAGSINHDFMMSTPPKSNQSLLPSYQSATSTPTSAFSSFPPPPYTEVQRPSGEIF